MKIDFFELGISVKLKYSVIISKDDKGYVFVKHKDRATWEIPGGHIEYNETSLEAAKRELEEEAGAKDYTITEICNYSVRRDNNINFGRLFYANITSYTEELNFETIDVCSFQELPKDLTYPKIQPFLFREILNRLKDKI